MPRSSAAAATGPSTRARTLAGGCFTLVSGTSNTPFATVSLRPDGIWTTPRPSVTVVVRPLTRVTRSTSRICGRLSNGCRVAPVVWIAIDKPSSGTGGPPERKVEIGALVVISPCSIDPPAVRSDLQPWVRRGVIETTRHGNADALAGHLGAIDVEPPLHRINPALHQDAVEDERLLVRAGRRQHH